MTKKGAKGSADQSIPIRVTQAKNTARAAKSISRAEDQIQSRHKKNVSNSKDLDALLSMGGKKIDMSKLDQGNRRKRILIRITLIFIILFALTFAGFWIFSQNAKKFGQNIQFSIAASDQAASGEVITLVVSYKNNEAIDLKDAELVMQFPEGFRFQSSSPTNVSPNTWSVGDLEAGSGGVISIRGQLVGDVDVVKVFTGTLTYTPSNFNYPFEEEASASVTLTSSVLSVEIDAPVRVAPGKEFSGTITYKNTSEEKLSSVRIELVAPNGFTLSDSDPEADEMTWSVDTLATDDSQEISFSGTLSGDVGTQQQFAVRIGFVDDQETFNLQTEKTFLVLLIKSGLTLSVEQSYEVGSSTAEWGDTINYKVTYTNDGDIPLEKARFVLDLVSETSGGTEVSLVDWNGITSPDKGVVEDSSIVWNADSVSSLELVKPGDSGSFSVLVPLQEAPTADDEDKKEFILRATANAYNGSDTDPTSVSPIQETKIATTVTLAVEGRYYSDALDELGSGPIPPQVGETTTYMIFWRISNNSNDIDSVTVSATLPSGVSWVGDSTISAGDPIRYNTQTRTVSWNINRIPAGAGTSFAGLEASFAVRITPTTGDLGEILTLVNSTSLEAQDTFTSVDRSEFSSQITTAIPTDPLEHNQGEVIAAAAPTNS